MRLVIQRVKESNVVVEGQEVASIGKGLLVLVGIEQGSDPEKIALMAQKTVDLRIFSDDRGKFHHSAKDLDLDILAVSQFTLCANFKKGRRPDFSSAARPELAQDYYERYCEELEKQGVKVSRGVFAADMKVSLLNDGPVTLVLDQDQI